MRRITLIGLASRPVIKITSELKMKEAKKREKSPAFGLLARSIPATSFFPAYEIIPIAKREKAIPKIVLAGVIGPNLFRLKAEIINKNAQMMWETMTSSLISSRRLASQLLKRFIPFAAE